MATQTQTIVETQIRPQIVRSVLKLNMDPPSPSQDSSSPQASSKSKSKPAMNKCDNLVRILAKLRVVKSFKVYHPTTNEAMHRLVKVSKNPNDVFDAIMDPAEAYIYKKLYIVDNHLVWGNTDTAPKNIYVVRCANDTIKLVNTKQAQSSKSAFALFQYEIASKHKQSNINEKSHFHFEAKERKALQLVALLSQCKGYQDCQDVMMRACTNPDRHPKILRGIYDFAQKLRLPSHLTWEEICYQDIASPK